MSFLHLKDCCCKSGEEKAIIFFDLSLQTFVLVILVKLVTGRCEERIVASKVENFLIDDMSNRSQLSSRGLTETFTCCKYKQ